MHGLFSCTDEVWLRLIYRILIPTIMNPLELFVLFQRGSDWRDCPISEGLTKEEDDDKIT